MLDVVANLAPAHAVGVALRGASPQRADRSRVMWPARVRRFNESMWHGAVVLDLSISGALLELACRCQEGEWLSIDIEYPMASGRYGQYTRCAQVIRARRSPSTIVAVRFVHPRLQSRSA